MKKKICKTFLFFFVHVTLFFDKYFFFLKQQREHYNIPTQPCMYIAFSFILRWYGMVWTELTPLRETWIFCVIILLIDFVIITFLFLHTAHKCLCIFLSWSLRKKDRAGDREGERERVCECLMVNNVCYLTSSQCYVFLKRKKYWRKLHAVLIFFFFVQN